MTNFIFDKVYIISYIKNIEKQNRITSILNNVLNINNFEFIYGIDMHISDIYKTTIWDTQHDKSFIIENNSSESYASHAISCGIAHFTAIQHAYYHNFNNCLIIEDDVLLYKNLDYVYKVLSYYPNNADIIQYGYIMWDKDYNIKYDEFYNFGNWYAGAQCYGICNNNTLYKIINNYLNKFYEADNYNLYNDMIIYNTNIPIFIDPSHQNNITDYINLNNYI